MGLKEWAEKNKAGGEVQQAKKAERAAKRQDARAGLAATKAQWDASRESLAEQRAETRAEAADAKAQRHEEVDALRADATARSAARATERDAREAQQADRRAAKGESFEGVTLKAGRVTYKGQGGPVAGAAARVESAADVRSRVTAGRVLALGVFALAAKKQTGHVFLTVEGQGFEFVAEVPVKKESEARAFAARVNSAAKRA